jgi:ParB/RepB/Spo0J family partition protein
MTREYREIPVNMIDADDHTCLISYPCSDENLSRSVEQVGILNPLLLRRRSGKFQIIAGFRRLSACMDRGIKEVPALLCPEDTEPLSAFRLAVHDNLSRGFNLIEKGNILHKLVEVFQLPAERVAADYMPLLRLNPSRGLLMDHLSLGNLTGNMRRYVHETDMPVSCAARMASFSSRDQEALLTFLHPLRPGVNKLRELLVNVEEVAARQGDTVAQILSREELKSVTDSDAPRPLKIETARKALKKMRFPAVTAAEARIEGLLKSLGLPREIALHLPLYLEGDTIRVELRFKSAEGLKRLAEKLVEASDRDELDEICELL